MMSWRQIKFIIKHTLRSGPHFAYWCWKARTKAICPWRNPYCKQPLETVSVHVLSGGDQMHMALWMLASWFETTQRNWKVYLYDDGSLGKSVEPLFSKMGIVCCVIEDVHADKEVLGRLRGFPSCEQHRKTSFMARKFYDPWVFSEEDRYVVLDTDILFFKKPTEILSWVDSGRPEFWFNEDVAEASQVTAEDVLSSFGFKLWDKVNAGLSCISRQGIHIEDTERFLSHGALVSTGDHWMLEQTLYALHASKYNVGGILPLRYELSLGSLCQDGAVCRHYVGAIRSQYYTEGIAKISSQITSK